MEKVALFIDAANISHTCRLLNMEIDYSRFLSHFRREYNVVRANYYTALITEADGTIRLKANIDWLSHHGFNVVTKRARVYNNAGVEKIKGNTDMEMAVDMIKASKVMDRLIVFTGDGDFSCLIQYLQETEGVQVTVISTIKTMPPMVGSELRMRADSFIDLALLRDQISKQAAIQRIDLVSRLKSRS